MHVVNANAKSPSALSNNKKEHEEERRGRDAKMKKVDKAVEGKSQDSRPGNKHTLDISPIRAKNENNKQQEFVASVKIIKNLNGDNANEGSVETVNRPEGPAH